MLPNGLQNTCIFVGKFIIIAFQIMKNVKYLTVQGLEVSLHNSYNLLHSPSARLQTLYSPALYSNILLFTSDWWVSNHCLQWICNGCILLTMKIFHFSQKTELCTSKIVWTIPIIFFKKTRLPNFLFAYVNERVALWWPILKQDKNSIWDEK